MRGNVAASAIAAVRVSDAPFAVAAAVRALAAGGTLLVLGAALGDWKTLGVAYLGAACSVAFAIDESYRSRAMALAAASAGAAIGIVIGGSTDHGSLLIVAVAMVAAAVSGLVGAAGPHGPAFGMMLSIGVAYGQFGGSDLTPVTQAVWFLVGVVVVGAAQLVDWPFRRGVLRKRTASGVFAAAADVCATVGQPDAREARLRLMAASTAAQRVGWSPMTAGVSYSAAAIYAEQQPAPPEVVNSLRAAAEQVLHGQAVAVPIAWPTPTAGLRAMAAALDGSGADESARDGRRIGEILARMRTSTAGLNAVRTALCLGTATAVTVALHDPHHSFWLPMTVSVIVRPEYASIMVRTINRVAGTIIGAAVAAAVISIWPSGIVVAVAASLGLGFAALMAPKLYGLSVIGVTVSALLSASVGGPDLVGPQIRLLDTVVGAAIAVVIGYVLWPGARRLPQQAQLDDGVAAAEAYLRQAAMPRESRTAFERRRDDAYRLAHDARSACLAAFAEPPPVPAKARAALPYAEELEEIVDGITDIAAAGRAEDPQLRVDRIQRRLDDLRVAVSRA